MQAPVIVFDHISKQVLKVPTGPATDKRLDEVMAAQREQVATSGRPSS